MPLLTFTPTRHLHPLHHHIEKTIGQSPMVFHEIVSADIHLDLHMIPPQSGGPAEHPWGSDFYTLVTCGMSTHPLSVSDDADPEGPHLMELMISLPEDWPGLRPDGTFIHDFMHQEANWWPIRWLKMAARMPYENGAGVGIGHIIPNGERMERYAANTRFGGMILLESVLHPKAERLVVHDDRVIEFLALWPLYPEEILFKQRHGTAALKEKLKQAGVTDLVNIRRPSVVPMLAHAG